MAPAPTSGPTGGPTGPQRRSVMGGANGNRPPAFTPVGANPRPTTPTPPAGGGRRAAGGARNGGTTARGTGSKGGTGKGSGGKRAGGKGVAKTGHHKVIDYPRQGKSGIRRWLPSWRLILGAFATVGLLGVLVVVVWYSRVTVPTPSDFAEYQTTTVYFSDGTTPMGTFAEQNRTIVAGETIPEHVKQAVVAAEDRTFYENPGINPAGIARALYLNVTGKDQQGGSSITQQYAERYYSDETISDIRGKIEEAMLAVKLARVQDKDQILANYLNTIYFGRDSYGIEAAARAYFGVGVAELDVSQGALLAGLIPSPNNFDPRISLEQAERRWDYVLDGMVITGALSQAERDAQVFPQAIEFAPADVYAGPNGYLLDMVRRELVAAGFPEAELGQRGYRITTTIDPGLQQMAVESVAAVPADHSPNLRIGVVTLEPGNGAIRALYGGPDYLTIARNAVTQDGAQAGSTFKPFALVAYLEAGNSLRSRFNGNSNVVIDGYSTDPLKNFGRGNGQSFGEIDVVKATANSVNTVYAQMNVEVGFDATLDAATRAGVCASWAQNEEDCSLFDTQHVFANVLGTSSPHPLDMAQAFNTFANKGVRTEPYIVQTVTDADGGVAYESSQNPERAFAADVMADTTYALSQVVEQGTAQGAQDIGYPVAGKTGTSSDNKSAWFIGYTAQLTTAVAMYQVGTDDAGKAIAESITPFAGYSQITGGSAPLDLWTAYMTRAMAGREVIEFPARADIGEPNRPPLTDVPNVTGMPEADATATLQGAGFTVSVQQSNDPNVAEGLVIAQSPAAPSQAEQGSAVTIVVSLGAGEVDVPDVVGQDEASARADLEAAGFVVTVTEQSDLTVPAGDVISQDPGGGQAPPGSTVTIVVSTGPEIVPPVDPGGGGDGG